MKVTDVLKNWIKDHKRFNGCQDCKEVEKVEALLRVLGEDV